MQFLNVANGHGEQLRIAYDYACAPTSSEPGLVWFPGLNSTMANTKVSAIRDWAAFRNRPLLRFDYSGHGSSDGEFTDGTIGQWYAEARALLGKIPLGSQVLVGSSMGAWLVLLILRAMARKDAIANNLPPVAGAVLIAPAFDMTEELMWNQFPAEAREALMTDGFYEHPSKYSDGNYKITRSLIEEGRQHLIGSDTFTPPCPVRVIHGIMDPEVPWQHADRLNHILDGPNVMIHLIQDGDHRLSRPKDIDKMLFILDDLYENLLSNTLFT